MIKQLPNILTVSRLLLLPVIFGLFFFAEAWAAWTCLVLYAIGAATDWFDGWYARKHNIVTPFGTFLDPIADKVFVAALLILLVGFSRLDGLWMALPVLILTREFLVSGMREFLGPKNIKVPVTKLAKWKTTSQMVAIGFLIIGPHLAYATLAGKLLLLIATVLTIVTGWQYLKAGKDHIFASSG